MRTLFRPRGRFIAVLTILVTSVLLTWVTWSAMSSPSGTTSGPGIDITPRPLPSGQSAPASHGATETATPSAHHSPQVVEPPAPAAVDPQGQSGQGGHAEQPAAPQEAPAAPQAPPAAPQAPLEDDDADDDDVEDAAEPDD
ncbi:hypothetical protein J5X07_02550 [Actinomyces bowdenii]|uniref:Uncharacterized protein n=1 Tax=Actinomyces bowdenii TaxID=131109 RepID=A0A3P1UUJ8_9ACTO|nr:hypothetical protein [Actinomyces bowdenii]MBO3723924.1 hypothetical protein [Actinomyces bowdenii]RRD25639.1 hypothetical protein EII10_10610 [Actinomyces bowdenii]